MAGSYFIPPPLGGLNSRDPVPAMPETDALTLDNCYCETGYLRKRGGSTELADIGSMDIKTLFPYTGTDGTRYLITIVQDAVTPDNRVQAINVDTAAVSTIGGAIGNPSILFWSACQHAGRFYAGSSSDPTIMWGTGMADATVTGFTGPASPSSLYKPASYRNRLYWTHYLSTIIWYTVVYNTVGGPPSVALSSWDPGPLYQLGGYTNACGAVNQAGGGLDNLFFACSTVGEVIVFSGDNPLDSQWRIVGRFQIPPPSTTRHPVVYVENEAHLVTSHGPISINWLLSGKSTITRTTIDAEKIKELFTVHYGQGTDVTGGVYFPLSQYVVIHVGNSSTVTDTSQYVMNLTTKAWSKWTGLGAIQWAQVGDNIYYGGANGKIYKADQRLSLDMVPSVGAGTNQTFRIRHAYNYLGQPALNKKVATFQPIISAAKSASTDVAESYRLQSLFDFGITGDQSTGHNFFVGGSDTLRYNREIHGLTGQGKAATIDIQSKSGGYDVAYDLRYYGGWVTYTEGGAY